MKEIYLIRHGKTEANLRHLYCGSTDLPLSEQGARELRELRYDIRPEELITSGMERTEQTCTILFGEVPRRREPQLRELDFGKFEMQSYEMLKDDPQYIAWITGDNHRNIPPGGESGEEMEKRVIAAFETIRSRGVSAAVVTHGGVIAAIMAHLFPEEGKNRYEWQPEPGHGYAVADEGYHPIP